MPAQDDKREHEMILLFNLQVPPDRKRADIDAHLKLDGRTIDFELKSTTKDSVSTVRDFGPDHIRKWRTGLHWLFAFYDSSGEHLQYCIYASPKDMEPWIAEKERYILPDQTLATMLPQYVTEDMVVQLLGRKSIYSLEDAQWIMKKQWKTSDYESNQDLPQGFSLGRMTEMLQLRANYVLSRGSTLNNPHIEKAFFERFDKITEDHAVVLRDLVRKYYDSLGNSD